MLIAVSILPYGVSTAFATCPAGRMHRGDGAVIAAGDAAGDRDRDAPRQRSSWRLAAPLISILSGCAVAGCARARSMAAGIAEAGWFGIPELPPWSLDLSFGQEFWALLPSFAIITLVFGIKGISDGVIIQQASRRRPRSIDFRQIQGLVGANSVGIAARRSRRHATDDGIRLAQRHPDQPHRGRRPARRPLRGDSAHHPGLLLQVRRHPADDPRTPSWAPISSSPSALMFVNGLQMVLRDGLDSAPRAGRRARQRPGPRPARPPHRPQDLFGDELGALLGNGVMIGAIVAIVMTLLLDAMGTRRSRPRSHAGHGLAPGHRRLPFQHWPPRLSWDEPLHPAAALRRRGDARHLAGPGSRRHRRIRAAASDRRRPPPTDAGRAGIRRHHAPRRTSRISSPISPTRPPFPTADDLSLRLLWFHASAVRHQKFHGGRHRHRPGSKATA